MKNPTDLNKKLLSAAIAGVLALSATSALALEGESEIKTYIDPATGQIQVAPKLLSQMTEQEKAALNAEEVRYLEKIEMLVEEKEKKPE